MDRKLSPLILAAFWMSSAISSFAQAVDGDYDQVVTPVPKELRLCTARMANENRTLELSAQTQQDTVRDADYDVSIPIIVDGKKAGYRT